MLKGALELRKSMAAILEEAASKTKKADKVKVLQDNNHVAMRIMLALALNPNVEWDLPEGDYQYRPNPIEIDQDNILYNEMRKFYLYLKPNHVYKEYNPNLSQERRKMLFIQLLEQVDRNDALMVDAARKKKLHVKLSKDVIEEAFPGLLTWSA